MFRFPLRTAYKLSKQYRSNEEGSVALAFALLLTLLILFVGGAVDFARLANVREKTKGAMDAAVLSAGRALQTGASDSDVLAAAANSYKTNTQFRSGVLGDDVTFAITDGGVSVTAKGTVLVNTPFLRLAGIKALPAITEPQSSVATTAQHRHNGTNREVALVLDVSGSMCDPCTKRDAMKAAAKDLIDIMMRNNSKESFSTKIALVPFSGDVRPPKALTNVLTDPLLPDTVTKSIGRQKAHYKKSKCVGERSGPSRYLHTAPTSGSYLVPAYNNSNGDCIISQHSEVVPLSDDPDVLKRNVNALATGGGTAGHVGTAWAYYMLSPEWSMMLPAESRAAEFDPKKVRKVAILLTDGEFNMERDSSGLMVNSYGSGTNANGTSSSEQAMHLCNNMKADGIEVFTVGFDLGHNQRAIDTLSACASDGAHAYLAEDSEALGGAFRDIAIQVSELHLSK